MLKQISQLRYYVDLKKGEKMNFTLKQKSEYETLLTFTDRKEKRKECVSSIQVK